MKEREGEEWRGNERSDGEGMRREKGDGNKCEGEERGGVK